MTEKEFEAKWKGVDKDTLEYEQMKEFIGDCYALYEETGFLETFDSPYDDNGEHNVMRFEVVRRSKEYDGTDEGEVDLEAMPIWLVRFENGDEALCYPEEICKLGHKPVPVPKTFDTLQVGDILWLG